MAQRTAEEKVHQSHARMLLAEFQGAPVNTIPRRETIVNWLTDYLDRSDQPERAMEPAQADDLNALDGFLSAHRAPATAPATLSE